MKKTIFVIVLTLILGTITYFVVDEYTTLFWKMYVDDSITLRYPKRFSDNKEYSGEKYFCTKDNRQGLNDCISYKFESKQFDRNNIRTVGGTLAQEDLHTIEISDKKFLLYSDGDAAYYSYTFVYELTDKVGYYEIYFQTNTMSKWNINRDINAILSKINFRY